MVKFILKYSVLIFFFVFLKLEAQNIEVTAETDTTDYYVGDYIHYRISLKFDDNIKILPIGVKDSLKNIEFLKEEPPVKSPGKKTQEVYRYVFAGYDSAGVTIPEIPIYYTVGGDTAKNVIKTNAVEIAVHTIEVDPAAEIRDVKDPLTIPLDWIIIFIVVLVLVLLAVGFYFWYRNYKKKKAGLEIKIPKVIIPPHKIAMQELKELEEKKLWQQSLIKEYHSEITGIIRKYFEARFNILALEMPSSELLNELKNMKEAQNVFDTTRQFLENADMVKFAKFKPMPSVNEEMMKQAYSIVEQTKPVESVHENKTEAANV